ncbi:hypothetical protein B7P43_G06326 [Cryptotermes secundus]|uniref:Uncharacterized protein n=1 Tax=Cryptotermes secundus TaxID=105785 RepID=A0A2J7RLF4_9NEOP|nr:hypothetical protein B7P43_G06326 [Cryptotermes secundus]
MSEKDLKMLAQSLTENMIVPLNKQEAIDAILLHSATQLFLLLQEGIPREILFRCLHSKESTTVDIKVCEANELACQFTNYFYSVLNQHDMYHQGTQLGVQHFWQNCKMQFVLNYEMGPKTEEKNRAADVVQLICNNKIQHNLFFNPNLENKGVHKYINNFGVVTIMALGTLHQQNKYTGVFEHLFHPVRGPSAMLGEKVWGALKRCRGSRRICPDPLRNESDKSLWS